MKSFPDQDPQGKGQCLQFLRHVVKEAQSPGKLQLVMNWFRHPFVCVAGTPEAFEICVIFLFNQINQCRCYP